MIILGISKKFLCIAALTEVILGNCSLEDFPVIKEKKWYFYQKCYFCTNLDFFRSLFILR